MKKHNETKVKLRKTIIRIKNCYKQKVTMKTGKYYYYKCISCDPRYKDVGPVDLQEYP